MIIDIESIPHILPMGIMAHQGIILLHMDIPCLHLLYHMIHIEHPLLLMVIHLHLSIRTLTPPILNMPIPHLDLLHILCHLHMDLHRHTLTPLDPIIRCRPILILTRILIINRILIRIPQTGIIDRLLPNTHLVHGMSESENEIRKIVELFLQVLHLLYRNDQGIGKGRGRGRGIYDNPHLFAKHLR